MFSFRKNLRAYLISITVFLVIVYTGSFPLRRELEYKMIRSGIAYENLYFQVVLRSVIVGLISAVVTFFLFKLVNFLWGRLQDAFEERRG